ncbi:acyclic terpene utilization AtuA family protein [Streptacidiphilus jiangxiensis]|uniref:acyclic terpene utilization AtuA family protein n=1 Tax=Streptacidiphilus jiangxiensis TaxID=235985 RepID=UPI000AB2288F|nr:acyclic terpene utilization AtuA family protein [Streptacidiphilus jiangxiensis]
MSESILRVGNASGFYGDRFDAVREMLTGGPLDLLTGDYLAELTMLILGRERMTDPSLGYAKTFLRQMEECLGLALDRGVRIVVNAGGLNPAGLAERLRELAATLGLGQARIAHVEGDDVLAAFRAQRPGVLAANAYLGGWGITACLDAGADVVVTGRVTDAALVSGTAAAHFGWARDDWDRLAGAVAAGHVLECGTQATGGNFSFFHELSPAARLHPGFPLAEIHPDGSAVITKHDGTGGAVTVETVTAQLLYETGPARYAGPDVTTRLDTIRLEGDGPDRVRISGVRGEAPPPTLKVGVNRLGGWLAETVFVLTGLDVDAKAELMQAQLADALDKQQPAELHWTLARTDHPDAATEEEASALLRLVVRDQDPKLVRRATATVPVELALAGYPGFHVAGLPQKPGPYGVFEALTADPADVRHTALLPDGSCVEIAPAPASRPLETVPDPELPDPLDGPTPTRRAPLGAVAGARSGDKGGSANIGVWARSEDGWRWLAHTLTVARLKELLPEAVELTVTRTLLPNLRALNFTVEGILGDGVASRARFDPQAKALGEWLRSRCLDIPEALLNANPNPNPNPNPNSNSTSKEGL